MPCRLGPRRSRRPAFVLLEVLISLVILGVATTAFMRSFTSSLNAARLMEVQTQAGFFGQQLMDEFEIFPPAANEVTEGGFGEAYSDYWWRAEMEIVSPKYDLRDEPDRIDQFFALRPYMLQIYYETPDMDKPLLALELNSAIIGFEKFSAQSKQSYANY